MVYDYAYSSMTRAHNDNATIIFITRAGGSIKKLARSQDSRCIFSADFGNGLYSRVVGGQGRRPPVRGSGAKFSRTVQMCSSGHRTRLRGPVSPAGYYIVRRLYVYIYIHVYTLQLAYTRIYYYYYYYVFRI